MVNSNTTTETIHVVLFLIPHCFQPNASIFIFLLKSDDSSEKLRKWGIRRKAERKSSTRQRGDSRMVVIGDTKANTIKRVIGTKISPKSEMSRLGLAIT